VHNNALVNVFDVHGWTPLHYAARQGHEDIFSMLIDSGANLNLDSRGKEEEFEGGGAEEEEEEEEEFPGEWKREEAEEKDYGDGSNSELFILNLAARGGSLSIVQYILSKIKLEGMVNGKKKKERRRRRRRSRGNVDPFSCVSCGNSALQNAASFGQVKIVQFLLNYYKYQRQRNSINLEKYGDKREKEVVEYKDPFYGRTALIYAAINGQLEVIELLLDEAKADWNVKDNKGRGVVDYARDNGIEQDVENVILRITKKTKDPSEKEANEEKNVERGIIGGTSNNDKVKQLSMIGLSLASMVGMALLFNVNK